MSFRLDADLVAAVRAHETTVTAAIEAGLRLWLEQRRKEDGREEGTALVAARPSSQAHAGPNIHAGTDDKVTDGQMSAGGRPGLGQALGLEAADLIRRAAKALEGATEIEIRRFGQAVRLAEDRRRTYREGTGWLSVEDPES